jgi:hypothetical protein
MRSTRKLRALVDLIRRGQGDRGIYQLARTAGRPYRRVHDQVQRLARAGVVRLTRVHEGPRTATCIQIAAGAPHPQPKLSFNRAWSRPSGGLDAETLIAQVLGRPTFPDLLACVQAFGLEAVRRVFQAVVAAFEIQPGAATASGRMLKNIEIGRARAARVY